MKTTIKRPEQGWPRFTVGLIAGLVVGWLWMEYIAPPLWDLLGGAGT